MKNESIWLVVTIGCIAAVIVFGTMKHFTITDDTFDTTRGQSTPQGIAETNAVAMRRLDNERLMIERWNGILPETLIISGGEVDNGILLNTLQRTNK